MRRYGDLYEVYNVGRTVFHLFGGNRNNVPLNYSITVCQAVFTSIHSHQTHITHTLHNFIQF